MILSTHDQAYNFALYMLDLNDMHKGVIDNANGDINDLKIDLSDKIRLIFGNHTFSKADVRNIIERAMNAQWER